MMGNCRFLSVFVFVLIGALNCVRAVHIPQRDESKALVVLHSNLSATESALESTFGGSFEISYKDGIFEVKGSVKAAGSLEVGETDSVINFEAGIGIYAGLTIGGSSLGLTLGLEAAGTVKISSYVPKDFFASGEENLAKVFKSWMGSAFRKNKAVMAAKKAGEFCKKQDDFWKQFYLEMFIVETKRAKETVKKQFLARVKTGTEGPTEAAPEGKGGQRPRSNAVVVVPGKVSEDIAARMKEVDEQFINAILASGGCGDIADNGAWRAAFSLCLAKLWTKSFLHPDFSGDIAKITDVKKKLQGNVFWGDMKCMKDKEDPKKIRATFNQLMCIHFVNGFMQLTDRSKVTLGMVIDSGFPIMYPKLFGDTTYSQVRTNLQDDKENCGAQLLYFLALPPTEMMTSLTALKPDAKDDFSIKSVELTGSLTLKFAASFAVSAKVEGGVKTTKKWTWPKKTTEVPEPPATSVAAEVNMFYTMGFSDIFEVTGTWKRTGTFLAPAFQFKSHTFKMCTQMKLTGGQQPLVMVTAVATKSSSITSEHKTAAEAAIAALKHPGGSAEGAPANAAAGGTSVLAGAARFIKWVASDKSDVLMEAIGVPKSFVVLSGLEGAYGTIDALVKLIGTLAAGDAVKAASGTVGSIKTYFCIEAEIGAAGEDSSIKLGVETKAATGSLVSEIMKGEIAKGNAVKFTIGA